MDNVIVIDGEVYVKHNDYCSKCKKKMHVELDGGYNCDNCYPFKRG